MEKQRRNARAGEAGFTLVEALIAIIVLVFGLMAIANLFVIGTSSNLAASQGTAAVNMASQQMELFKSMRFEDIAAGGSVTADVGACNSAGAFCRYDTIVGVGEIRTRWQVNQVDGQSYFMRVRSEATSILGARTRAEFTTFRSCTAVGAGCPAP